MDRVFEVYHTHLHASHMNDIKTLRDIPCQSQDFDPITQLSRTLA